MSINLKPHKNIRLAVSHDVFINKLETSIIDTPTFQRLRKLKQLGSSDYVFPTAIHNRFIHSIGTLHMSNKMIKCIRGNRHNDSKESKITPEQEQLIRLTALLHDIGHIPFGHTIEDEFNIFPRHDQDTERLERLIGRDSKIGNILRKDKFGIGEDLYNLLFKILTTKKDNEYELGENLFIYDIVNNTVCADLLDYLQRDCFFCDLPLGVDYRFLNYLYLYEDEVEYNDLNSSEKRGNEDSTDLQKPNVLFNDNTGYESKAEETLINQLAANKPLTKVKVRRTAIRLSNKKGDKPRVDLLNELVALMDSRYKLGEIVYFHHAKLAAGAMIAGAVYRAKIEEKIKLQDLYEMGDEILIHTLKEKGGKHVKKLINAYDTRNLWKASSFVKTRYQLNKEQQEDISMNILEEVERKFFDNVNSRYRIEKDICDKYGFEDGDVLIHCPKNTMQMKLAKMNVLWEGKHRPLEECKHNKPIEKKLKLILDSHQKLWAFRVFINPTIANYNSSIKKYFENELCFSGKSKEVTEKAALEDWLEKELEKVYKIENINAKKYLELKTKVQSEALSETFGERTSENLKDALAKICKEYEVPKK